MNAVRAARLVAAMMACAAVAGCVIPLPSGESATTRRNVGDSAPESIIVGKTTRAEVVSLLGEPDSASQDGALMVFGRDTTRGGVMIVLPGAPAGFLAVGWTDVTNRRLVVRFDAHGLVSDATMERKDCVRGVVGMATGSGGWGVESAPCLDVGGQDLTAPAEDARLPTDEGEIARYDMSTWTIDAQSFREGDVRRVGVLAIADRSLVFLWKWQVRGGVVTQEKQPVRLKPGVTIPYTQMVRIEIVKFGFSRLLIVESRGRHFDMFQVPGRAFTTNVETEAAAEELKMRADRWRARAGVEPLPLTR